MNRPNNRRDAIKKLAASAVLTGAGGLFAACTESRPQFAAIDITGADYAQGLTATDHNGQTRTLKDFVGKVVVLFFGFAQCPDVCPTALAELAQVKTLLGKDGDKLQGLFFTVDPERDTVAVLKAYMANFDPSFLALRAEPEQLAVLAKDFKVYYKKVAGKTPTSYTMDHSAGSFVYDTQGRIRLYTRSASAATSGGSGAQALAGDIKLLLRA